MISENIRRQVIDELKAREIAGDIEEFLSCLTNQVRQYTFFRRFDKRIPNRSELSEELGKRRKPVKRVLQRTLHEHASGDALLDDFAMRALKMARARQLIGLASIALGEQTTDIEESASREVNELVARLIDDLARLDRLHADAEKLVRERPHKRAKSKAFPRLLLARRLAECFHKHLDQRPTSTRGSAFETVLEIALMLGDPDDPETGDLHGLARDAVAHLREEVKKPR